MQPIMTIIGMLDERTLTKRQAVREDGRARITTTEWFTAEGAMVKCDADVALKKGLSIVGVLRQPASA